LAEIALFDVLIEREVQLFCCRRRQ